MLNEGLVSVIIPVFNRPVFLSEAIQSVIDQSYPNVEIILVDDGSTDGTNLVVDNYAQSDPKRIRAIHIENAGPGGAREQGRFLAQGEFIQYLDSDDRLLPEKFATQVKALRSRPECGIAYGITRLIDEKGTVLNSSYKQSGVEHFKLFPELLVDRWWNTHTPLYRRSLCDQVGAWTTMRMAEDWEYDARMGARDVRLAFCPEAVSEHREHGQDRLTGGPLSHSAMCDFGRLIPQLYACALAAKVDANAPELQHLSRWAFSLARRLGGAGEATLAQACFNVAKAADIQKGTGKEFRLFERLVRVAGWKLSGMIAEMTFSTLRRSPKNTPLKQAWMK